MFTVLEAGSLRPGGQRGWPGPSSGSDSLVVPSHGRGGWGLSGASSGRPVAQPCPTLSDPMDCSTPGFPVPHLLRSSLKLMSIESVMPSNHLILCLLVLLPPSVFLSIRVFSSESALCSRWANYWSSIYEGTNPIHEGGTLLLIPTPPNTTTSGSWDFNMRILKRQKPPVNNSSSLGCHSWWWARLPPAPTILTECKSQGHFQNPKDFSSVWTIFKCQPNFSCKKRFFTFQKILISDTAKNVVFREKRKLFEFSKFIQKMSIDSDPLY